MKISLIESEVRQLKQTKGSAEAKSDVMDPHKLEKVLNEWLGKIEGQIN